MTDDLDVNATKRRRAIKADKPTADDEVPVIFPIEAKAAADAINRVQVHNMVQYAKYYYPGLVVRPLALKVDFQSVLHLMEFNVPSRAGDLRIIKAASYVIDTSPAQIKMIKATNAPKQ